MCLRKEQYNSAIPHNTSINLRHSFKHNRNKMDTYDTSPLTPQFRTSSSSPSTNTPSPTSDTTITTNDSFNNINPVERPNDSLRLKKNIGLVRGVSYVMGGIIGVGIFVSPQAVLLNTGGSVGISLCVWAFCAVVAFCGGLTYAELGKSKARRSPM